MHLLAVRHPRCSLCAPVRTICHDSYPLLPRRTYTRKAPSVPNHKIRRCAMATASRIQLSLNTPGVFHVPGIAEESAAKASEVLQENHENHHIFFNKAGFHSRFRSLRPITSSGLLKPSACFKSRNALCLRTTRIFLRLRALRSRPKSDLCCPTL